MRPLTVVLTALLILAVGCEGLWGQRATHIAHYRVFQGLTMEPMELSTGPEGPQGPQGETLDWVGRHHGIARGRSRVRGRGSVFPPALGENSVPRGGHWIRSTLLGCDLDECPRYRAAARELAFLEELGAMNPEPVVVRSGTVVVKAEPSRSPRPSTTVGSIPTTIVKRSRPRTYDSCTSTGK